MGNYPPSWGYRDDIASGIDDDQPDDDGVDPDAARDQMIEDGLL